jgi:hypothetical protein
VGGIVAEVVIVVVEELHVVVAAVWEIGADDTVARTGDKGDESMGVVLEEDPEHEDDKDDVDPIVVVVLVLDSSFFGLTSGCSGLNGFISDICLIPSDFPFVSSISNMVELITVFTVNGPNHLCVKPAEIPLAALDSSWFFTNTWSFLEKEKFLLPTL